MEPLLQIKVKKNVFQYIEQMKVGSNVDGTVGGHVDGVCSKSGAMLAEPLVNTHTVSPAASLRNHRAPSTTV